MKKLLFSISILFSLFSIIYSAPAIEEIDRVRIAEAYSIGEKLQDQ